jgi:hypothetical protein
VTYTQKLLPSRGLNLASNSEILEGEFVFALEHVTDRPALEGEVRCITSRGVGLLGACWLEKVET